MAKSKPSKAEGKRVPTGEDAERTFGATGDSLLDAAPDFVHDESESRALADELASNLGGAANEPMVMGPQRFAVKTDGHPAELIEALTEDEAKAIYQAHQQIISTTNVIHCKPG